MSFGIGPLGGGVEGYLGPLGKPFSLSLLTVFVFNSLFPQLQYIPDDSRFSWLSSKQIESLNNLKRQIFEKSGHMELPELEAGLETEPELEAGLETEPELEAGLEIEPELEAMFENEPGPKLGEPQSNIPYHDQSIWEQAGKTVSAWMRGVCLNGINLDPKTVRTATDAATIAGGFGAMLLLLYLAKKEPKTDYYYLNKVTLQPPSDVNVKSKSSRLQELEEAILKINSAAPKAST